MRKTLLYLASFVAIIFLLVLLALATAGVRASPGTLYVKVGGSDLGDCTSTPCASIGYALTKASPDDTIKVAQGTYTENITIDKDVTLEGGYESTSWTRDIEAYETIVDGSGSQTVPGDWDGSHTYGPAIISDTGLYKMWYSGGDLYGSWRIGYAESSNGIDWTKSTSNPVLEPGSSGEWDEAGVIQMSVMKDGATYKMWYTGWDEDGLWQIGYATSTNGLDWVKYAGNPVLEVGSPGEWNEDEVGDPSVILDGSTYKMWYYGTGGAGPTAQVGYATSPDGINWTESVSNPVLTPGSSAEWDDEHVWNPSVLSEDSTYKMWYAGSDGDTQRIGHATSPNGITWNKYAGNPVLDVGSGGKWDESHVYLPMVITATSMYKMWYTGRDSDGDWRIGYATSPDGVNWTKYADNPVLTPGTPGQWGEPVVYFAPGSDGAVLDGLTITGGDRDYGGGIVVDDSSPTIRNCTITDNNAFYSGGGIFVWGGSPVIESNTISGNTVDRWDGGGIAVWGGTPTISENLIEGNTASSGGGLIVNGYSTATVDGNNIVSNMVTGPSADGGGISIAGGSIVTVTNNVIASNIGWNGDGIVVSQEDSDARIINNTIVSNSAEGIQANQGTVLARNNIIYGNDGGLHNYASGATISSDHNAFWENGWDYLNVTPGPGDISVDPLFVDAAAGDYHLYPDSLCTDRGTNTGAPSTDFEGDLRPFDGDRDGIATVDMGADEYIRWYIYLPLTLKNY